MHHIDTKPTLYLCTFSECRLYYPYNLYTNYGLIKSLRCAGGTTALPRLVLTVGYGDPVVTAGSVGLDRCVVDASLGPIVVGGSELSIMDIPPLVSSLEA